MPGNSSFEDRLARIAATTPASPAPAPRTRPGDRNGGSWLLPILSTVIGLALMGALFVRTDDTLTVLDFDMHERCEYARGTC